MFRSKEFIFVWCMAAACIACVIAGAFWDHYMMTHGVITTKPTTTSVSK